jgi:flavin-dependent dehydrogenase
MKTDVAIIGGGPGGSTAAMYLARQGIRSTIVEKFKFPRYHIGESMIGELGGIVRDLGLEQRMLADRHPVKYAAVVLGPQGKGSFRVPIMARCPQRGLWEQPTWQVRRSNFDEMMLNEAASRGAEVIEAEATEPIKENGRVRGVRIRTADGRSDVLESEVLIDATGQYTFLSHHGITGRKERGKYDKQVAIFSQVAGAIRDPGKGNGDTIIYYQKKFHWAWFIPLDAETVSVGIVVPGEYFASRKESKHDFFVREVRELHPSLSERIPEIRLTEEVRAILNYSFHIKEFTGPGFICIGDAHRFIDPIFSFGLYFTMKEAQLAAPTIAEYLGGKSHTNGNGNPFAEHQRLAESGMDVIQDMMDAFWQHPLGFALVVHQRYIEQSIDIFAGRVYSGMPNPALLAMKAINEHVRKKTPVAAM